MVYFIFLGNGTWTESEVSFPTHPEVENTKSHTFQDMTRTQHTFPFTQVPSAGCDDSLEEGV